MSRVVDNSSRQFPSPSPTPSPPDKPAAAFKLPGVEVSCLLRPMLQRDGAETLPNIAHGLAHPLPFRLISVWD